MTSHVVFGRKFGSTVRAMRAGRLVTMLRLLQARGSMTAGELARELEVSTRTVLRDIEELSGAGIPVYATRGPNGGFHLLDGFDESLPLPTGWVPASERTSGPIVRARILVSPRGRQLVALLGAPAGLRVRRSGGVEPPRARADWAEASVRIESIDAAVLELLALGPEVEVIGPAALRSALAASARKVARLNAR